MQLEFNDGAIEWPEAAFAKGYTHTAPEDRAAWLDLRKQDVTASAAGALVGVHDWMTALKLWSLKSGATEEDPEESPAMQRGRLLEPVALQLLREQRPAWTVYGGRNHYWRDPARRIGCTPDVYGYDDTGRPIIIQTKSVEPSMFVKKWQGGDRHADVEPPLWIAIQAIIEAEHTGAERAFVAPLLVSWGVELPIIEIPLHQKALARIREEVAKFWHMVEMKLAPSPDYGKDGEIISKLYPIGEGLVLDLTDDNMLPDLVAKDEMYAADAKVANAKREEARNEIRHKLGLKAKELVGQGKPGEQTTAIYNGGVITAKNVFRRSYTTKDTTFVDMRCKPGRDASETQKSAAVKPKRGVDTSAGADDPEVF